MDTYTKRRLKELQGAKVYMDTYEEATIAYTQRRMKEIEENGHTEPALDNSALGCYTVSTMGDRDGET
jgi:hypothetical protein